MHVGRITSRWEPLVLFLGDVIFLYASLWAALFLRRLAIPEWSFFESHLKPFTLLFVLWIVVFFIAGLYDKHTSFLKKQIPTIIFNAQVANSVLAIFFFYFIPYFGITPKTTLFILLCTSFVGIVFWRRYSLTLFDVYDCQPALLIGSGPEMEALWKEINENPRYGISFVSILNLERVGGGDANATVSDFIDRESIRSVVVDTHHDAAQTILPSLYSSLFSGVQFLDMHKVYEDVFDRVPLSLLDYNWFLENISMTKKIAYEFCKRIMDIAISIPLAMLTLVLLPFVCLAIKLDDKGPIFIVQERIGKDNKRIWIPKFRTMRTNDRGVWVKENDDRITRVGRFLRKSRIDELPQLFSVLKGDMSLVGPRPDIYDLGLQLAEEIPYYVVRNVIKPGLSGWAQIRQKLPPQSLEETKLRLAYDFYYIKNRSLFLDIKIALKTLMTLVSRAGK